jgi:hypothetical protein
VTEEPPADRTDDSPPPRLFGVAFWAAMVFAILCIAAGYAFARYGPRLFPAAAHSSGQGASIRKEIVL